MMDMRIMGTDPTMCLYHTMHKINKRAETLAKEVCGIF